MTLEEQIEEIMDEFDFEKVHKVMKLLNWKWVGADDGVPRIAEMRRSARDHLARVANVKSGAIGSASGGFVARRETVEGQQRLSLAFEIASWEIFLQ